MLLNAGVIYLLAFLVLIWLAVLTFWVYKTLAHYKNLVRGTRGSDLKSVLEKLLLSQSQLTQQVKKLNSEILVLDKKSEGYTQKIGLVRFSPYADTGGNQSFALALLNGVDTGVVLLSLHNREGTRIYLKPIEKGKSSLELSKEEVKAVEEAKKSK